MDKRDIIGIVVICVVIVFLALWNFIKKQNKKIKQITSSTTETFDEQGPLLSERYDVESWVINLDKNTKRWKDVSKSYQQSDMSNIPLVRFSAVVGKNLNPKVYLSQDALKELETNEKQGYRTRHYQLSKGAIGCFLSHYELFIKLTNSDKDMFLIFEDDVAFPKNTQEQLSAAVNNAPKGWDIILFGFSRLHGYKENDNYIKPMGFWGTSSYVISKGGALKFLKECDIHKMDAQIDAYMSYLSQKGKLNIYAVSERIIAITSQDSDIQFQGVRAEKDADAFMYKGLSV